jgi:hypothetical protein
VVPVPTPSYKRRSRHTLGGIELPRCDGRTVAAKRFSALVQQFSDELGGGTLSAVDAGLVRQAAALSLRIEQLQAAIVSGEPVNNDETVRLSSEHRRILASLRSRATKNRPAGATALQDYLARKAEQAADTLAASK